MAGKRSPPNLSLSRLTSPHDQIALMLLEIAPANPNHIGCDTYRSEQHSAVEDRVCAAGFAERSAIGLLNNKGSGVRGA